MGRAERRRERTGLGGAGEELRGGERGRGLGGEKTGLGGAGEAGEVVRSNGEVVRSNGEVVWV